MNFTNKVRSLIKRPDLRRAYVRWILARLCSPSRPVLNIAEDVRLGGWLGFSEYWTFGDSLPRKDRAFIEARLRGEPKPVAFDLGANIGVFTCFLAKSGAEEVHAFEPIPETFCRLKRNTRLNGVESKCHLNCLAVGQDTNLVTFRVTADSPATNRLACVGKPIGGPPMDTIQRVATVSLDTYCQATGIDRIAFLKIDVEGMEPLALQGARHLLQNFRVGAILIEVCPVNLRSVGFTVDDLVAAIKESRYVPYRLEEGGDLGRELHLGDFGQIVLENVVLLPGAQ